ncbi:MAG: hypothetical protein HYR86_09520, partial [Candidatus Rokubacteria bacterium]|nr:hypothetical protein [Candidatus Rokubacteria bacterium]
TLPIDQPSVIAVTVSYTVAALGRPGPVFVEGQEIERVRVVAMPGGATRTAFITRTGRELVPAGR